MNIIEDLTTLSEDQIEAIEKVTMRWLFQAVLDFGYEASEIFHRSPDDVKDIAEDITREILDRIPGYNVPQRIYGTVDYKRARYIILPENTVRQALFVDSKAEKSASSATLQKSQISLFVRQVRAGANVDVAGLLPAISLYHGLQYLTTTAFLHYHYSQDTHHRLHSVTIAVIPNGRLQAIYNPDATTGFWLAGRDAPTLGEEFRVRISFALLAQRKPWRVQRIRYDGKAGTAIGSWRDDEPLS